jgi:hypothetical protein
MSTYVVNKLVRSKDEQGDEKLFLEMSVTDELGTYTFEKWLAPDDFNSIKDAFGDLFGQFNDLNGFTADDFNEATYTNVNARMAAVAENLLPDARAHKEASNTADAIADAIATANNGVTDPIMIEFNIKLAELTACGYLDPVMGIRIKGDNRAMVERWTPQMVSVLNFLAMGLPTSTPMDTYAFNDTTVPTTMGDFQQLMARFAVWFNTQFATAQASAIATVIAARAAAASS